MQIKTTHNNDQHDTTIARWTPKAHAGQIHLIAGTGRRQETPESKYSNDVSIADIIAVFASPTEVTTYTDCWVGQAWFRQLLDPNSGNPTGGNVIAGRLTKSALTSGGNEMWHLETLAPEAATAVQDWADQNITGDTSEGFTLAGEPQEPDTISPF